MAATSMPQRKWWKESVVYQIYPSTFADSNGDGWGDVRGITSKLDYLKDLGVDIIWVSPIYKSPQADMGYDIADYKQIDRAYGSLEDVDMLISELGKREMKLMMDLVVNHTSNEHAWFLESASSKASAKRDWYIWKPPRGHDADGKPIPPNNWMQLLGDANSAWTYSPQTGEFYLSLFTPEQPDLNWENKAVRAAVHDVMDFWLKRGVRGFRMDVINLISKDQRFPDAPQNMPAGHTYQDGRDFYVNGPRMHEFLRELHAKVLSRYDTVTVGEMPHVNDEDEIVRTVGADAGELDMIFIFDIVDIDNAPGEPKFSLHPFDARDISRILARWQRTMRARAGWNALFLSNHDQPRAVSRYTDDSDTDGARSKGAKLLALMQSTLAGTLFVYQGEELGMRNVPASWDPELEYKDVEALNFWKKSQALHADSPDRLAQARRVLQSKARDNARTPMQWDGSPNAGFCKKDVTPWMRVNDDYTTCNAAAQVDARGDGLQGGMSVWQFWQRALRNRKAHADVFVYGDFELLSAEDDSKIFAYVRGAGTGNRWLTVLNFSGESSAWAVPQGSNVEKWVAGNYGPGNIDKETSGRITLRPWEGVLGKCVN